MLPVSLYYFRHKKKLAAVFL